MQRSALKLLIYSQSDYIFNNSDKLLMPASNNKLFIGAAALHYLGPDYFFQDKSSKTK